MRLSGIRHKEEEKLQVLKENGGGVNRNVVGRKS